MTEKQDMRREAKKLRAGLAEAAGPDAGYRMAGHFVAGPLAAWKNERSPVVAGYWPHGTEMNTKPLLEMLVAYGFQVALPVGEAIEPVLTFRRWEPTMTLEKDGLGMNCPPGSAPFVDPDIVMVPALAFDARGYRIGYGAGCYDATLRVLRILRPIVAAAVVHAGQEVPEVPAEAQDEAVDWIVTELYSKVRTE